MKHNIYYRTLALVLSKGRFRPILPRQVLFNLKRETRNLLYRLAEILPFELSQSLQSVADLAEIIPVAHLDVESLHIG